MYVQVPSGVVTNWMFAYGLVVKGGEPIEGVRTHTLRRGNKTTKTSPPFEI